MSIPNACFGWGLIPLELGVVEPELVGVTGLDTGVGGFSFY